MDSKNGRIGSRGIRATQNHLRMSRGERDEREVSVREARRRELARVMYLAAVDSEAREEAARTNPGLASAFALDAAFGKAIRAAVVGSNEAVLEMIAAFRAQVARKLEAGELIPDVKLREAVETRPPLLTRDLER